MGLGGVGVHTGSQGTAEVRADRVFPDDRGRDLLVSGMGSLRWMPLSRPADPDH